MGPKKELDLEEVNLKYWPRVKYRIKKSFYVHPTGTRFYFLIHEYQNVK